MKKLLIAFAAVLAATAASANEGAFIGIGANIGASGAEAARITVPINVAPVVRIEPFIGVRHDKITNDNTAPTTTRWDTEWQLGCAGFFVMKPMDKVELLAGGRLLLGVVDETIETVGKVSESGTIFGLAAVGGAEYYLAPQFALGVEASLGIESEEIANVRTTNINSMTAVTAKVFFK